MGRIAIVIKNSGFLRYIQTQIEVLCARGHHVHLAIQDVPITDDDGLLIEFQHRFVNLSVGHAVSRRDQWRALSDAARGAIDTYRYSMPEFDAADGLRQRAERTSTPLGSYLIDAARALSRGNTKRGDRRTLERLRRLYLAVPPAPEILEYLRQLDIDLLLVTGLVWPQSAQSEYVIAARTLGIPTGYIVNSWDNLTNKGDMKARPDIVYVWNAHQADEASQLHGMPRSGIRVVGAPLFDRWFEGRPTLSADSFRELTGLPSSGRYLLYVGSSPSIAPGQTEVTFFAEWLAALRSSSSPELRDINVLVRPHPFNAVVWDSYAPDDPRVSVYPRHGRWIVRASDRQEYFDALYHCSAVVGINTSAMIEAAIVGARTFAIKPTIFKSMQDGTLHFRYLTELGIAAHHDDLESHFSAIAAALSHAPRHAGQPLEGVVGFVRADDPNKPSTTTAVDAIEAQMAARPERRARASLLDRAWLFGILACRRFRDRGQMADEGRIPEARARYWYADRLFPKLLSKMSARLPEHRYLLRSALKSGFSLGEFERLATVDEAMQTAAASGRPIVIGPWVSEVGFEVLYWIPFVRWFVRRHKIPRQNVIIVSRGGTHSWYGGIGSKYVDVLALMSPAEFRLMNVERTDALGHQKQSRLTDFESELCRRAAEKYGVSDFVVFDPSIMFRLFPRYWKGIAGQKFIEDHMIFAPIKPPASSDPAVIEALPERYIAVKFYFRESFPDTAQNRRLIADVISRLADHIDVVVLSTSIPVDDHSDSVPEIASARVHVVDPMAHPATNLRLQTAIIGRAEAFVGTYGGLSYVASLLGKTSFCFETVASLNRPVHTELAMRRLHEIGGRIYVLSTADMELLSHLFGPGGALPMQVARDDGMAAPSTLPPDAVPAPPMS